MVYAKVVEGNHRHEATSVACDYTGWERARKSLAGSQLSPVKYL